MAHNVRSVGRGGALTGADVGHNGDLGRPHDVGAEEGIEERSEGSLKDPSMEWMKNHFTDSISVPVGWMLASDHLAWSFEERTHFCHRAISS
jgi:hypothetical protein